MSDSPASHHERVFLVVVDASPEMRVALRYAALRARRSGGRVALLHVIEPPDRHHWMALENLVRQESMDEAQAILDRWAGEVMALTGVPACCKIREGKTREELFAEIDEDPSISILVLAAGTDDTGPGPLVTAITAKNLGKLRVPVTIVPGHLSDAAIDALT
jgi:nucleotide-binding universal stress UspA family protein